MIVLKVLAAWLSLWIICAPVLIPVLVRRYRSNYRDHRASEPASASNGHRAGEGVSA